MKIYLIIGFMGSGKTTTGKIVAKQMGLDFIDTDSEIESNMRCSIKDIFDEQGEAAFRKIEHQVFTNLIKEIKQDTIISVGGGLLTYHKNIKYIKKYCITIFLDLPWSIIKARLANDSKRPLLSGKKGLELYKFWQNRQKTYLKYANYIIKVKK